MEQNEADRPHYIWPRYVLAGVVLGIVLAVVWMSVLVRRVHDQRDFTAWPKTTNSAAVQTAPTTNVPSSKPAARTE